MIDLELKYASLIEFIKKEIPIKPDLCLILGSGLGDFADNLVIEKSIPTNSIPDYPSSTVKGHKGFLHFSKLNGHNVLIFQGRIHFYEGYTIDKCILPAYISVKLGVKRLLITNAAGGINSNFSPGDLMLVTGLYAQNIKTELSSLFTIPAISNKDNLQKLPSKEFNKIIMQSALEEKINLKEGTYWFNKGPTYETPAEIRMQSFFGADSVGMSTVHEAIYAAYHGIQVASISLITNYAAGLSPEKLSHNEVIETAELAKKKFEKLVLKIIENSLRIA